LMDQEIRLSELIAPDLYDLHREIKAESYDEYWLKGGRGSTKSTFISMEILLGIIKDPEANAVVFRRYQNELRDTVYGQCEWSAARWVLPIFLNSKLARCRLFISPPGRRLFLRRLITPGK